MGGGSKEYMNLNIKTVLDVSFLPWFLNLHCMNNKAACYFGSFKVEKRDAYKYMHAAFK